MENNVSENFPSEFNKFKEEFTTEDLPIEVHKFVYAKNKIDYCFTDKIPQKFNVLFF